LEQTYRDLQHSHEHLLRAEKMAALGRLTAGIAHEINTPLGASLTSLKLMQELVQEYSTSIGDSEVEERDHQEIAAQMDKLVRATQQWMEKAAAHIRSLKLHTRDLKQGEEWAFSVSRRWRTPALLLAHRLRLSQCTLTVSCTSLNLSCTVTQASSVRYSTNLTVNAIDAYKDAGKDGGEIRINVSEVWGYAGGPGERSRRGVPPENIGKIFDEFFSTKALGEGQGWGSRLRVTSSPTFLEAPSPSSRS